MQKLIPCKIPKRYVIVTMVFIGYVNFYYLHTNIGMAVVDMTSNKKITLQNGTIVMKPEYEWTSVQKALVISSFAYGRFFGPLGAVFAGKIGGSTLYSLGVFGAAVVTFCMPLCLYVNFYLFVLGSALAGGFEACAYASVSQLWSRWAPPDERAKCISFSVIGIYGGSIVSFLLSGWILQEWGWAVLFYASGLATLVWFWIWFLVVKNDPSEDLRMSQEERNYIKDKINDDSKTKSLVYPWKDMLTCVPLWMGCLCKFSIGAGYTFTMMYLPQYIKDTNDIDIKEIGYFSLIPQICSVISMPLGGYIFDRVRSNKTLSLTNAHKLYACLGLFSGTLAFSVTGLWPNFIACIICLSLFQFFSTCTILGIQILVLDLAPRYAAFMNSITNSSFTISSILTPVGVGFVVTSHSQLQWSFCFIIFSALFAVIGLLYAKFASVELQFWANYSAEREKCQDAKTNGKLPQSICP
ncbi:vesicular glutamate transporter 3-like [Planococcus citri]|uniref:vesicular glutamate transporter 3-like n=1 Tax=Planococcus citri TaxID=170843 RepID=UPI0031F88BEE